MMEVLDEVVVRLAMPVIIGPNLATTTMPDDDILTYSLIVRRAAEYAVAEIARPFVADGSRMYSSEKDLSSGVLSRSSFPDSVKLPVLQKNLIELGVSLPLFEQTEDAAILD
jgi:uncharacterized protein (DUF362 family)